MSPAVETTLRNMDQELGAAFAAARIASAARQGRGAVRSRAIWTELLSVSGSVYQKIEALVARFATLIRRRPMF